MKAKQTEDARRFHKCARPHRWTGLPGAGLLAALSGTLLAVFTQAAAPVSLTLKGQWPPYARGTALDVAVQGQYAYVPTTTGFRVLDASDPANPTPVGGCCEEPDYFSRRTVAVSGSYAYVGNESDRQENGQYAGGDFQVIDVSDPTKPARRGKLLTIGVLDLAASGNYAYVVGWRQDQTNGISGMQVIDVGDPDNPQRVGGYDTEHDALGVTAWGNHVGVVHRVPGGDGSEARLEVLDISKPAAPHLVGTLDLQLGFSNWSGIAMAAVDNHVYIAAGVGGVIVIDISDPTDPKPVGRYEETDFEAGELAVANARAYVMGLNWTGDNLFTELRVLDLSDPAKPMDQGRFNIGFGSQGGVAVAGNAVFAVANSWDWFFPQGFGVQVIDVSDPMNPARAGGYNLNGRTQDIALAGQTAYLADGEGGLRVIDVSNPAQPRQVGDAGTVDWQDATGITVAGNLAYLNESGRLEIFDLSNGARPRRIGRVDAEAFGWTVAGNYLYTAGWRHGANEATMGALQVFDVSHPADPLRVGGVDTSGYANDVTVVGNYAYVTANSWDAEIERSRGSLHVIDVSNPANPMRVADYETSGYAFGVAVVGSHAYVADRDVGLRVIDVSNPTNIVPTGSYAISGGPTALAVAGGYAYVASSLGRLHVLDVSDPANPRPAGGYDVGSLPTSLAVAGNRVYVGFGEGTWHSPNGVLILEQSPARPPAAEWHRVETDLSTTPPANAFHGMVYDSVRGVVLLHGGNPGPGSPSFTDTWAWDGKRWERLSRDGPRVLGFGFAFDTDRGVAVLHGGLGEGSPRPALGDTWEWDGQGWRKAAEGPEILKRAGCAMAYDPQRKRLILHGGTLDINATTILSDTWEAIPPGSEGEAISWREIPNANGPPRLKHRMVYDEKRQVMVLFGGLEERGSAPVDTWEFDGAQWRQVATQGPPGGREFPAMAYDSIRGVTVLSGGGEWENDGFPAHKAFNDTWEWDGEKWTEAAMEAPRPSAAQATAGAYDPRRGRIIQFGGTRGGDALVPRETWEYGLAALRISEITRQAGGAIEIRWNGGAGPYQLQRRASLTTGPWQDAGTPTDSTSALVSPEDGVSFFRVVGLVGNAP